MLISHEKDIVVLTTMLFRSEGHCFITISCKTLYFMHFEFYACSKKYFPSTFCYYSRYCGELRSKQNRRIDFIWKDRGDKRCRYMTNLLIFKKESKFFNGLIKHTFY